jgi:Ni,Fe-hydrogenase III small subunit/ferredoxin
MFKAIYSRLKQGYRTIEFPSAEIKLPPRFPGMPLVRRSACKHGCDKCAGICPAGAITLVYGKPVLDLGRCIFCGKCAELCPGVFKFTKEYRLAARERDELFRCDEIVKRTRTLDAGMRKVLGRSLKLRQVSAGGCGACEADCNVLQTLTYDLGRFGIQFVASPRHADGLLITGPVTQNMKLALQKTYDAVPRPKIVIAAGACAISGGIYAGHPETAGIPKEIPLDLYIPGCPPHPLTILDGLLRLLGRID